MKAPILPSIALCVATSVAAFALLLVAPLAASEIAATHVVFEKPTKMKKADTFLYLSLVDQSRKGDSAQASRLIDCRVFAEASSGPLPVKGTFRLRLLGEAKGSGASWTGSAINAPLDGAGRGTFQPAAIAGLVDQADSAGASARLMRIEFDGGKGKKVRRLTIDCENKEGES